MLMCEKAAQQNLCEKGGVPEAQPILCMIFVKKENLNLYKMYTGTFVNNGVCFFNVMESP